MAVFSLTLKQSIYCPRCFLVRLCVIQFTRYRLRSAPGRCELRYSSTPSFICQELFSSSFKFLPASALFAPLAEALRYITITWPFCQALFSLFLIFFSAWDERKHPSRGYIWRIKWNKGYKRLRRRGIEGVILELGLISCGFNLYKYHPRKLAMQKAA